MLHFAVTLRPDPTFNAFGRGQRPIAAETMGLAHNPVSLRQEGGIRVTRQGLKHVRHFLQLRPPALAPDVNAGVVHETEARVIMLVVRARQERDNPLATHELGGAIRVFCGDLERAPRPADRVLNRVLAILDRCHSRRPLRPYRAKLVFLLYVIQPCEIILKVLCQEPPPAALGRWGLEWYFENYFSRCIVI